MQNTRHREAMLNTTIRATLGIAAVCFALLFCAPARAQQTAGSSAAAQQAQTAQQPSQNGANTTSATATIPSYPDSPKGLDKLMKNILKLEKRGDEPALASYYQSLVLPDPNVWLKTTYGEQIGSQLAASYSAKAQLLPHVIDLVIKKLINEHMADHFNAIDSTRCGRLSFIRLDALSEGLVFNVSGKAASIYRLRFWRDLTVSNIGSFIYSDGAFRYLGEPAVATSSSGAPEASIQTDDSFQMPNPAHWVGPEYPIDAKINHIQGTVVLHAMIGKDGLVRNLSYISGPLMLRSSAIDAVQQWEYQPALLNGKPVAIDICISIVYDLD